MYDQDVSPAPIRPDRIGLYWGKNGAGKIAHQLEPLLCSKHQRVEISTIPFRDRPVWLNKMRFLQINHHGLDISTIPFRDRVIWLNKMRFLQIQKHAAVVTLDNFVTPTFRLRFV